MSKKNIITEISKKSFKKKLKKLKTEVTLLNNRYYLGEKIGIGGLSIVYKATDIYCDYFNESSNIVIKMPSPELQKNKDIAALVYSEYSFLREMNYMNIVKTLDFGIDEKSHIPYIVLEYLEGETLSEIPIISMDKKFKNRLFRTLINTVDYIHSKNIIHADINPSNIMINKNTISLFDFGISQKISEDKKITLEYEKVKAYNPIYSAPEILLGSKPSKESDIFSLACVMYEIYNSKPLFDENTRNSKINNKYAYDLSNIPILFRKWFKNSLSNNPKFRVLRRPIINLF